MSTRSNVPSPSRKIPSVFLVILQGLVCLLALSSVSLRAAPQSPAPKEPAAESDQEKRNREEKEDPRLELLEMPPLLADFSKPVRQRPGEVICDDFRMAGNPEALDRSIDAFGSFHRETIVKSVSHNQRRSGALFSPKATQLRCKDGTTASQAAMIAAALRFGVPPSSPRLRLALGTHFEVVDASIASWAKSRKQADAFECVSADVVGLTLVMMEELAHAEAAEDSPGDGKEREGESKKARKAREDRVQLYADALAACVRSHKGNSGWRESAGGNARSGNSIDGTFLAMRGLIAASRLGAKLPRSLVPRLEESLRWLGSIVDTPPGDPLVEIRTLKLEPQPSNAVEWKEVTLQVQPKRWRDHGSRSELFADGTGSLREWTMKAVASLVMGRHLTKSLGGNPWKHLREAEFTGLVWSGVAYMKLRMVEAAKYVKEYEDTGESDALGKPTARWMFAMDEFTAMTGNRYFAGFDWYPMTARLAHATWTPLEYVSMFVIRGEQAKKGKGPEDPETLEKIREALNQRLYLSANAGVCYDPQERELALFLRGGSIEFSTTTPVVTGGGKSADGNKSSDDKPADGKPTEGKPADKKDGEGDKGGENKAPPAPEE